MLNLDEKIHLFEDICCFEDLEMNSFVPKILLKESDIYVQKRNLLMKHQKTINISCLVNLKWKS